MTALSHILDDGRTRVVAVVENQHAAGQAVTLHQTKWGQSTTTLVTTTMSPDEAYALGEFLVKHARPRSKVNTPRQEKT